MLLALFLGDLLHGDKYSWCHVSLGIFYVVKPLLSSNENSMRMLWPFQLCPTIRE